MRKPTAINDRRRDQVLQALREYRRFHPRLNPTVRELCELSGIESTSLLRFYLKKLAEDGWIEYIPRISRGVILNDTRMPAFARREHPEPFKMTRKERRAIAGEL